YAEPKSSTNSDYNPFREDYIETGVSEEELKTAFDDPFMELPYRRTSQPAKQSAKPSSGRLSDVSWTDMAANKDFAIPSAGAFNSVPSESYREIASDYSQGIDLAAMMGMEEESSLEFVASAVQQSLECEQKMEFSSAMPLVGGYVLAQSGGRSMLVDMRRAKERILYDSYMAMIGAGSMASQRLLFPERLTLSEDDFVLLSENEVEFAALGFELNLVGDGVVELNAIPSSIVGEQADEVLYELLREVESGDVAERMRSNMARVMAVKGSRLSSKGITAEEAMEVLQHLCACDNYSFSPSGKAIMAEFTIEDIKAKLN
ncbi:MAG: DNA mismatch repair protein MutL, partial [Alistipes sp.]|nr:DNA mismatch repair protein MutL [Alistipes sp.]